MKIFSNWQVAHFIHVPFRTRVQLPHSPQDVVETLDHLDKETPMNARLAYSEDSESLIVNALDVEAAAFWGRRGFIPSKDDPLILFRSIADIAASLG